MARGKVDPTCFGDDDATLKELILDTACRVRAIEEMLEETRHPAPHGTILVAISAIEGRAEQIKRREPYRSGYQSVRNTGATSHSAKSYLRLFLRNLLGPMSVLLSFIRTHMR